MFTSKTCIAIVLLSLQAAHSRIVIPGTPDRVHYIGKPPSSGKIHQLKGNMHYELNNTTNEAHSMQTDLYVHHQRKPAKAHARGRKPDAAPEHGRDLGIWKPNQKVIAQELNGQVSDSSNEAAEESAEIIQPQVSVDVHRIKKRVLPNLDVAKLRNISSSNLEFMQKMLEAI